MSTNIHVHAEQTVTNRFGNPIKVVKKFEVIQTPSSATFAIMEDEDRVRAYINHCVETSIDEEEKICDDYDEQIAVDLGQLKWEDAKSKRIDRWNWGKEHAKKFQEWVDEVTEEGYEIVFEAW